MTHYSDSTCKKVVQQHIQNGRIIQSLATEYGVSKASISNWVRDYRKECQSNDEEKSQLELLIMQTMESIFCMKTLKKLTDNTRNCRMKVPYRML